MGNEFFKVEIESLLMVMDHINFRYEERNFFEQKKFSTKLLNQCEAIINIRERNNQTNYKVNICDKSIKHI